MYELNRIRLINVGPRAARYSDVTLDLSDAGQTVPGGGTLFAGPPRRPSPTSLLLLENGGGKTVLLKLMFSVILPGKRSALGGSANAMRSFILDRDTSHVALEWMHTETGAKLVTAKVLQARSGDDPDQAWYTFRPSTALTLETLPVADADNRRLTLARYRQALIEADRSAPTSELVWEQAQRAWTEHLRNVGLEPDLFDIQRSMNVDEGGAAGAFSYTTSGAFVDWLLGATLDPADMAAVSDNFATFAGSVAQREMLELERDYLTGAIAGLEGLADTHDRLAVAFAALSRAQGRVDTLNTALEARSEDERGANEALAEQLADAKKVTDALHAARDRANNIVNEVRRQTALLELADAQQAHRQAETARGVADLLRSAWAVVPAVADADQAEAASAQAARAFTAAVTQAAPALVLRDEAAGRLLAGLQGSADDEDAKAEADKRDADAAHLESEEARKEREGLLSGASALTTRIELASKTVNEASTALADAIAAELVPVGTGPGDVADIAAAADVERERGRRDLDAARAAVKTLADAVAAAEAEHDKAVTHQKSAADASGNASRALDQIVSAAEPIISDIWLRQEAGEAEAAVSVDDLDQHAERLAEQLARRQKDNQLHLDRLRVEHTNDQRIADALGNGNLLPERTPVTDVVTALAAAGISAYPGWRYLSSAVSESQRANLIAAHPHLADGVVLALPTQLDEARRVLREAQLLPDAAVAVAGSDQLLAETGVESGFVVDPSPAMYDTQAAAIARDAVDERMSARAKQIEGLAQDVSALATITQDIARWRNKWQAGSLLALCHAASTAADALSRAGVQLADSESTLAGARAAHAQALAARETATGSERCAHDRGQVLTRLADEQAAAAAAADNIDTWTDELCRARQTADEQLARQNNAVEAKNRYLQNRERCRDRASRARAAMNDVLCSTREPARVRPPEPIGELRAAYDSAQTAYSSAAPGEKLKEDADSAAEIARRKKIDLAGRNREHVDAARALLATAEGADRGGWEAAAGRAQVEYERLDVALAAAAAKVALCQRTADEAAHKEPGRTVWIQLPDEWKPENAQHGRELFVAAEAQHATSNADHDRAVREQQALADSHDAAAAAAGRFAAAAKVLSAVVSDTPGTADPFIGTPDDADAAAADAISERRATSAEHDKAATARDRSYNELTRLSRDEQYEALTSKFRRQVLDADKAIVSTRAREWARAVTERHTSLQGDLDKASKHRSLIVDGLVHQVDLALKTLRRAQSYSKLPDTLGDWSGREFLLIRFAAVDGATLESRVSHEVDRLATEAVERGTTGKPPGFELLLKAVKAAVPGGFDVRVLKPDQVLRDERVAVADMSAVFSGGQEMTAAIMLYCTLAALKANERGRIRHHAGVLFLDNPIGKASAQYLLDLQKNVAEKLGVQLVYTTGLYDDRVMKAFPLWLRLRNDADLRAGLKYIRVADEARVHLPEQYEGASGAMPGTVTASRVLRRPDSVSAP